MASVVDRYRCVDRQVAFLRCLQEWLCWSACTFIASFFYRCGCVDLQITISHICCSREWLCWLTDNHFTYMLFTGVVVLICRSPFHIDVVHGSGYVDWQLTILPICCSQERLR